MKIETLFRISRLLIPNDVWTELRELQHLIEDAVWAPIGAPEWPGPAMASIEDLLTWWSFIKQDLQDCGLLSTNETPGAPGTNVGEQANPYEPPSESIFRNNNWVKLAAFIKSYCEGPLTDRRVESLKNSLQAADRSGEIKLPK